MLMLAVRLPAFALAWYIAQWVIALSILLHLSYGAARGLRFVVARCCHKRSAADGDGTEQRRAHGRRARDTEASLSDEERAPLVSSSGGGGSGSKKGKRRTKRESLGEPGSHD